MADLIHEPLNASSQRSAPLRSDDEFPMREAAAGYPKGEFWRRSLGRSSAMSWGLLCGFMLVTNNKKCTRNAVAPLSGFGRPTSASGDFRRYPSTTTVFPDAEQSVKTTYDRVCVVCGSISLRRLIITRRRQIGHTITRTSFWCGLLPIRRVPTTLATKDG